MLNAPTNIMLDGRHVNQNVLQDEDGYLYTLGK
jgi:hypothetical protein